MITRQIRWRPVIAVGLCLAVAVTVVGSIGIWLAENRAGALEIAHGIEPRYARLAGLVKSSGALESRLQQAQAVVGRLALPADVELARAGADLQHLLRQRAEAAGLGVTGSQILTPQSEGSLDRISVTLNLEGELPGLQRFLAAVAEEVPRISVRSMVIQPQGRMILGQPDQKLLVTLEFIRWRAPA